MIRLGNKAVINPDAIEYAYREGKNIVIHRKGYMDSLEFEGSDETWEQFRDDLVERSNPFRFAAPVCFRVEPALSADPAPPSQAVPDRTTARAAADCYPATLREAIAAAGARRAMDADGGYFLPEGWPKPAPESDRPTADGGSVPATLVKHPDGMYTLTMGAAAPDGKVEFEVEVEPDRPKSWRDEPPLL